MDIAVHVQFLGKLDFQGINVSLLNVQCTAVFKEKNWKSIEIGLYLAPGPLHHLTSSVQNAHQDQSCNHHL